MIMTKRTLSIVVLLTLSLALLISQGPCTLWSQSGCATALQIPGTFNPTLTFFLANSAASFARSGYLASLRPQPKPLLTLQNDALSGAWLNTNVSLFGAQGVNYASLMKSAAGVSVQDINVWISAFACAPAYVSYGGSALKCDAPGGAFAFVPYGNPAPSGVNSSTPRALARYYYDQFIGFAAANGITVRFGWFPSGNVVSQVNPSPPTQLSLCNVTGTITEAELETCVVPPMQAMFALYGSAIDSLQVLEEPSAGMPSVNITLTVADTGLFIRHMSVAAKTIVPGVHIGAAALGGDFNHGFWPDWTASTTTTIGTPAACISGTTCYALDFLVLDLFSSNCDPTYPGSTSYEQILLNYQGTPGTPGYLVNARGVNKPVRIGQSDFPIWCPIGGAANQQTSILGQSDVLWLNSGLAQQWLISFDRWCSVQGIQSVSMMFTSIPLFCLSANQTQDNALPGYPLSSYCMAHLSPTPLAATYKQVALYGPSAFLQGNVATSGNVVLGH